MTDSPTTTVTVDPARLTDWVGDRLPGSGTFGLRRMGESTGIANALFLLTRPDPGSPDGTFRAVLRRPRQVVPGSGPSLIAREWRILAALEDSGVPHPAALLSSEDPDVIGAPFLIMGVVDGFTPIGVLPAPYDRPENRRSLGFALVDAVSDLGALDWRARGLDDLGRPDGFLERQVGRWQKQFANSGSREIPLLDPVADWLTAHRPASGPIGLIHGDYSPFNVMATPDDPTRLAAVIDWDTGTIGDPLLDIGHLLARWTDPGEEPVILDPPEIVERAGLPTRAELAARYGERSGTPLPEVPWYQVMALFKLAAILEGGVTRAHAAGDPAAADLAARVDRLILFADRFARGERV